MLEYVLAILAGVLIILIRETSRRGATDRTRAAAGTAAKAAVASVLCLLLPRLAVLSPLHASAATVLYMLPQMMTCLRWGPDHLSLQLLTSCHAMKLVRGSLLANTDAGTKHSDMCLDIGNLGDFAFTIARLAFQLVTQQGCSGTPVGSLPLRNLLARPLLRLLGSPLLGLLAELQHVPVSCEADGVDLSFSLRPPRCSLIGPDADDAKLAMQVNEGAYLRAGTFSGLY